MNVLVICQHYYPEPFRLSDICEELVRRGNKVTVVTGVPNYPMGEIYPGYEDGQHRDEEINGVTVHRCPIHPRKTGIIHRVWNYYSYSNKSKKYIGSLDNSFDVVFVYQLSPVMMANAAVKYAKKHGKKVVLYSLDLWPASLAAGGISGGAVYNYFHKVSKKIYSAADKILITSKSFSEYFFEEFGIGDTEYLPQYAEELFVPENCKKEPDAYIDVMFAGNVGAAQSVETIIKAAAACKDIKNLRWHIVGDGKDLARCKALSEELDAPVVFHGRRPIEEMPRFYSMADAMLVTMKRDDFISFTLPGKVQSYMAAAKPIIGAIDGEAQRVINESECGLCADAEDVAGLAECVRRFATSDMEALGANSRDYYIRNYTKDKFINTLEGVLLDSADLRVEVKESIK